MKKLLFLCSFIFISMQVQAQMYVVMVKHTHANGPLVQTVIAPNGNIAENIIFTPDHTFGSFNWKYQRTAMIEISSTLNEIIANGYTLLPMSNPYNRDIPLGGIDNIYYLVK